MVGGSVTGGSVTAGSVDTGFPVPVMVSLLVVVLLLSDYVLYNNDFLKFVNIYFFTK